MNSCSLLVILLSSALVRCAHHGHDANDIHGGVQMGVSDDLCDNAKVNLTIDWDDSTDYEERCQPWDPQMTGDSQQTPPVAPECFDKTELPRPLHMCMNTEIVYQDTPPVAGPHRPLWPVYGEYSYIPPQRWVHALEHGAAVFLYHPCADPEQIESMKHVARSCLRKHIITPYRPLGTTTPYAVVTYGCRLMMSYFNEGTAKDFVKEHAMTAPERKVYRHGDYDLGLLKKAEIVSTRHDTTICPKSYVFMDDVRRSENMN